jgi:hypothetical protein
MVDSPSASQTESEPEQRVRTQGQALVCQMLARVQLQVQQWAPTTGSMTPQPRMTGLAAARQQRVPTLALLAPAAAREQGRGLERVHVQGVGVVVLQPQGGQQRLEGLHWQLLPLLQAPPPPPPPLAPPWPWGHWQDQWLWSELQPHWHLRWVRRGPERVSVQGLHGVCFVPARCQWRPCCCQY